MNMQDGLNTFSPTYFETQPMLGEQISFFLSNFRRIVFVALRGTNV